MRDRKKARARKREREAQKILNKLKGLSSYAVVCDKNIEWYDEYSYIALKAIADEIDAEIIQKIRDSNI